MLNAHEFNLFITPGSMPPVLHMAQYDSGRQWTAKLKADDGNAYTPASGATAKVEGVNGKGVAWELTATISGSSVIFTPSEAATDQFGKYEATLTIEKSGEQITALCLLFDIQKAGITNEEAAASPEFQTAMEAAAADAVEEAMTEAGILLAENQAEKTAAMTNAVGVDENGKLWCEPGESGQTQAAVLYDQNQSLNSTQKATARGNIDAYTKPSGGIPKADLASGVQTSLGKADTALQNVTAEAVLGAAEDFTSEQKPVFRGYIGAGTYSKPSGGIPATDLAGDIPATKLAAAVQAALTPKILTMTKSGNTYTYGSANFSFSALDDLITLVSGGTILWLVNTTTGSAYRAVNARGATSTGRLTFAGPTLESDNGDLGVEAFVLDGSFSITRKVLPVIPTPASGTAQNPSADKDKILTVDTTGAYALTAVSTWTSGGSYGN